MNWLMKFGLTIIVWGIPVFLLARILTELIAISKKLDK